MGTPNSKYTADQIEVIKDIFFDGLTFTEEEFHEMGLDALYLERAFTRVKPQLPYIPGYAPIQEVLGSIYGKSLMENSTTTVANENELCIRLTKSELCGTGVGKLPVLELSGAASEGSGAFEILLTRSGKLVVYFKNLHGHSLIAYSTTTELCERFDRINDLSTMKIATKLYIFEVAHALIRLFQLSIDTRQSRVAEQNRSMSEWKSFTAGVFNRTDRF